MKNRKVIVTAFLLVAALILGVGFAQLNDALTITGDATVSGVHAQNTYDEDVHFEKVALDAASLNWQDQIDDPDNTSVSAWINAGAGIDLKDTAGFAVNTLAEKDDVAIIWFKIVNEGTNTATVSVTSSVGAQTDATLFGINAELLDTNKDATNQLAGGAEVWVKVTVTLLKDPPSGDSKGNFTIAISAVSGS